MAAEIFGTGPVDGHRGALAAVPDALSTPAHLETALAATQALRELGSRWTPTLSSDDVAGRISALVLYLATTPTLIAHAVHRADADPGDAVQESMREHPPLRLLNRVAHDDVELGGQRISAGDHVVVDAAAVRDGSEIVTAEPAYETVVPLVERTAVVGVTALRRRWPDLALRQPLWHRRSPVAARIARWEVA
ncbi:hypothetical protein ACZ91_34680 [Streptomyces regensis]|nr:hypothetical protein ACZ91_34680 [Streptomyces regensis]